MVQEQLSLNMQKHEPAHRQTLCSSQVINSEPTVDLSVKWKTINGLDDNITQEFWMFEHFGFQTFQLGMLQGKSLYLPLNVDMNLKTAQ